MVARNKPPTLTVTRNKMKFIMIEGAYQMIKTEYNDGLTAAKIPMISYARATAIKGNPRQILLALFSAGLAGCSTSSTNTEGTAVKGLLENAVVFIDADGDGEWTSGVDSAKVRTDSEGVFTIPDSSELNGDIIVMTDDTTVDKSSGQILSGITLSATSGSSVVTVATTLTNKLMDSSTVTLSQAEAESKVKALLGLEESVDLSSFHPYSADHIGSNDALDFEKKSHQVMTVLNTLAEAESNSTLGTDVDKVGAMDNAVTAFLAVLEDQIDNSSSAVIDFTDVAIINDIIAEYDTGSALKHVTFSDSLSSIAKAIINVNQHIDSITTISADADPIFAVAHSVLVDMTQAVATANDNTLSTIDENTTTDSLTSIVKIAGAVAAEVIDSVANADAADHTVTGTAIVEGSDSSSYAFVIITNVNGDHGAFQIDADGNWTYTITDEALNALPAGTLSESFVITIEDSNSQSVSKLITVDLIGINDAPYVETAIVDQTTPGDAVFTSDFDTAFADYDDTSLTYEATLSDGSALPSWLTFGESNAFRIADSVVTWNDYDPDTQSSIVYNNSVSVNGNAMTINGSPTLNLTNLINAANDSGSYKIPSIEIDLLEVPTGSGSGTMSFRLLDGSDNVMSSSERYIQLDIAVEWVSTGASVSVTLPTQSATGHYITEASGRTEFQINNLDSDTVTVIEGDNSSSPPTLSVKLAALIDKLESVGSTSLLQEGDFNLTITTDLPMSDMNGTSITSLETSFSIADIPTTSNAFKLADANVTWTDYDPSSSSDVSYTTTASVVDNQIILNSTPVLNLANLQNAASGNDDFKVPTINIDIEEIPIGSGSSNITFKLLDGTNDYNSSDERYIELSLDVDWVADGSTASITLPAQTATGHYITEASGRTDFEIANLDSDTVTVAEGSVSSPASINVKLSAIIDKLESVGSISLLQEGSFNLTIETNLPLADMNGTEITTLSTNFAIASDPSSVTSSSTSNTHPDITETTFYGNPTEADIGSYEISVSATDLVGASITDTFTLEVM
jgi:VCBS repeat-containing protein